MRRAWVALGAALIAAALAIWVVIWVGDPAETGEDPTVVASEDAEPEIEAPELDLDPELSLEAEEVPETRAAPSTASVEPPSSASTMIAAPRAGSAFVRGWLRDERTEEPLPLYSLRIQDESGRWEDILTDESGRFATGSPMVGETIRIVPFDDPSHRRKLPEIVVERRIDDGETRDLDLAVPCGPTYRLAISPADAVLATTLSATLHLRSLDEDRSLGPETLRPGDPPWVRFAAPPRGFDRCDRMEVRSRDGLWLGSAKATAAGGVVPGLLDLVLEARAVLLGKVVDREGQPVAGARIAFEGVTASGRTYERAKASRKDGEFRMESLAGGSGTVSVRSLRHVAQDAAIRLPAGAITRQDFILTPVAPAGAIRGRLESETGSYQAEIDVVLAPQGSMPPESKRVRWEERGGRRVGVFEFEGLPAGGYEISVRDTGWFPWEPRTLRVSPPTEVASFLVRDDLAHSDLAFRPRDAETGANLDGTFAWWSVSGGSSGSKHVRFGERILKEFPLERSFRWRLDRWGCQPAFGDEKAFDVEEIRAEGSWKFAEVELVPGWGEVFRVVRDGNRKPVAGAKILLDGREAGTTKGDGTCTILARERPRRVEVVYRDWRTVSPVDMRAAWRRKERRFVTVPIAPPKR